MEAKAVEQHRRRKVVQKVVHRPRAPPKEALAARAKAGVARARAAGNPARARAGAARATARATRATRAVGAALGEAARVGSSEAAR